MPLLIELFCNNDNFFFFLSLVESLGSIVEEVWIREEYCIADFLH